MVEKLDRFAIAQLQIISSEAIGIQKWKTNKSQKSNSQYLSSELPGTSQNFRTSPYNSVREKILQTQKCHRDNKSKIR